jgi:AAA domain, putative AbiEii toxin, Type IV TA system/AAA domain
MSRPPLRIEELHIRSFRGIDELHLKFPADEREPGGLAVLAGDNGYGKTAVLEAVLLVLGKLDLLPGDAAALSEQVQFGSAEFRLEAVVRVAKEPEVRLVVDSKTLLQPPRPVPGLGGALEVTPMGPFWAAVEALQPNVEYFSARREPEALGETPDPKSRGARSVREARRVLELKKRLVNTYYRALQAGKGGKMPESSPFVRLQGFVQRFLGDEGVLDVLPVSNDPGADFEVVLRKGEIPADITSLAMARAEAVGRKDIPQIVPVDRLSSGQVALFAFAGPLIFRDAPADVVLIDEPEQHMHLQWQGHLIRALRELSPESQIIVATHSLDIADAALSYERFLLLREGDPRLRRTADDAAAE